jgi:hypothetical protein
MSQVWVRAKSILRTEVNGKAASFHPGDWLQVGKQQAREWLQHDQCEILRPAVLQSVQDLTDCTIVLNGFIPELENLLSNKFPAVPVEPYTGKMPTSPRFLLWDTRANLRQELILTGFGLLNKWQMACPLLDYDKLAQDVGTAEEREETKAVVHDLRVPAYDDRVMFVRQCRETQRLFELWQNGTELGLLRALYQSRPIINALPPSWIMP